MKRGGKMSILDELFKDRENLIKEHERINKKIEEEKKKLVQDAFERLDLKIHELKKSDTPPRKIFISCKMMDYLKRYEYHTPACLPTQYVRTHTYMGFDVFEVIFLSDYEFSVGV